MSHNHCWISIVVPAYNAARFLSDTVDSVLSQTFSDWELIIVNDGSIDSTEAVIQRCVQGDPRIRSAKLDRNGGPSAARNCGIGLSDPHAPYIAFLDADDVWEPDALRLLHDSLAADSAAAAAHGVAQMVDQNLRPIGRGSLERRCRLRATFLNGRVASIYRNQPTTFDTLTINGCIPTPGLVLMRKNILDMAGHFDAALEMCEDWDLYVRLSRHAHLRFIDRVILKYRRHDANLTLNRNALLHAQRSVIRKTLASPENDRRQHEAALRGFRRGQLFFIPVKLKYLLENLRAGDIRNAAREVVSTFGHALRYVTGRP